jgi:glycosyltransferase involved in cell wall biosynthesis
VSPSISVVIPVYNGEAFLRDAVESALRQSLAPTEIIVVDDGSSDGSLALARSLHVITLSQANQGVSAARNRAVERSRGDLVAFLDCDDIWLPHKLAAQAEALAARPEAGYAVSHIRYFLEPGTVAPAWFHWNSPPEDDISYPPSTWLIRRATWETVGPFDEGRRYVEDIDWLARANDLGVERLVVTEPLVEKRIRDESLTGNVEEVKKGMLRVLRDSAARKRALEKRG